MIRIVTIVACCFALTSTVAAQNTSTDPALPADSAWAERDSALVGRWIYSEVPPSGAAIYIRDFLQLCADGTFLYIRSIGDDDDEMPKEESCQASIAWAQERYRYSSNVTIGAWFTRGDVLHIRDQQIPHSQAQARNTASTAVSSC